jgi:hypothetical protein
MPLEQIGQPITFYAHYVDSGESATSLTVTCSVVEVQRDGTATEIVTDANATEIGRGFYRYILTAGNVDAEGEYLAEFKTTGTVDQAHIPAVWVIGPGWVENVDASIQTVDTVADGIKAVTDNLPDSGALTTIQADLDNPDQYKADVSALATAAALATVDGIVDDILLDTDELQTDWTDGGRLDLLIDAIKAKTDLIVASGSTLTAQQVWSYVSRTLTQTAAQIADVLEGDVVSVYQYTTWTIALTGLGDVSGRSKLYFTVKGNLDDADASTATLLQVEETDGLIYIDGAAATDSAKATLTVDNETTGAITISVDESVTGLANQEGAYDVKEVTAAGAVNLLTISTFKIKSVVTKAVT